VVTYTVIINAPNPDIKLMPGMTASTTIFVNEKVDIPVIPGKALRFNPEQTVYTSYLKTLPGEISQKMVKTLPTADAKDTKSNYIWVKNGQEISQREVKIGSNDGISYELLSGVNQGDEIVLSMTVEKAMAEAKKAAKSPFMPQRPGGTKR
jgi:HlyD family secretion protein